ncbi:4Fe-4S binding protein [Clostridia bacterium OttesenSCG-928-O13]|nr:4Fe-4S binding protein [Clostridia bacterium OttesenSCG-928-O13]
MAEYLELKTANCKHCYKCIRNCPVKAISFSNDQATIMTDECILCGRCFASCPQKAKSIRNDLDVAKSLIQSEAEVWASLAPSFVSSFEGFGIEAVRKALIRLGFAGVEETARGAEMVTNEYDDMIARESQSVILSSCCPSVNMLIQRHFPAALPYLAPVKSPMQAHCAEIKKKNPGAKTVFIGPCVAKKAEAEQYPGEVDCVLTFPEIISWLDEESIALEQVSDTAAGGKARLYPVTGGILHTMQCDNPRYTYIAVDGVKKCIGALKDVIDGSVQNCFIEMSACGGSCVGGPAAAIEDGLLRRYTTVDEYAGDGHFAPEVDNSLILDKAFKFSAHPRQKFSDAAIAGVLAKIGKTTPADELNCGSCGYDTCRDKAVAVLQGKADMTMCLPYLMGKAESFSDTIIHNTPNGIIVLNEGLEIQQINAAARRILNIHQDGDVLGRSVVCVMDPVPFLNVLEMNNDILEKRTYLAEYDKFVMLSVVRDTANSLIIGIMRDVTQDEAVRAAKKEVSEKTIDITDQVIEKQMRTVQEIASLLGETAAETKIALTKLKETLQDE